MLFLAAKQETVKEVGSKISEFEIIVAYRVTADNIAAINAILDNLVAKVANITELSAVVAEIETLRANLISADHLTATDIEAANAKIDKLTATIIDATGITVDELNADYAEINELKSYVGDFTYVSADKLAATDAEIKKLDVSKLSADFANINFAELNAAEIKKLYVASGLIEDVTADEITTTYLVGVMIKGDMIEAGTLKADQLVLRGTDGNYYKVSTDFNGLEAVEPIPEDAIHGSVIAAQSVTAEKVRVSDLVAFGATIGGFNIRGDSIDEETGEVDPGAIYSGAKESVDNTTRGSYLDSDGQFSFGDSVSFVTYRKKLDENGNVVKDDFGNPIYELLISADSLTFGSTRRTAEDLADLADRIKMGSYTDPDTGESKPSIELDEEFGEYKLKITNETMVFTSGDTEGTKITQNKVVTTTIEQTGGWAWASRANGNYGLVWKGVAQ